MKILFLFAILLISSFSIPNNPEPLRISQALTQIQSLFQTRSPSKSIHSLLDQIVNQIKSEQQRHDAIYENQRIQCNEETQYRENEILISTELIDRIKEKLQQCQSLLEEMSRNIEQNIQLEENVQNALILKNSLREQENIVSEGRRKKKEKAMQIINEIAALLENFSLNQNLKSKIFDLTTTLFQTSTKLTQTQAFNRLMMILSQVQGHQIRITDSETLESLAELLENYQSDIQKAANEDSKQESELNNVYEEFKATLNEQLENLVDQKQILIARKEQWKSCVDQYQVVYETEEIKVEINKKILSDNRELCEAYAAQYDIGKNAREGELEVIEKLRTLIVKRLQDGPENILKEVEQLLA